MCPMKRLHLPASLAAWGNHVTTFWSMSVKFELLGRLPIRFLERGADS